MIAAGATNAAQPNAFAVHGDSAALESVPFDEPVFGIVYIDAIAIPVWPAQG